ncbi:NAD(P)H-binding protein [bacterium]|nr:NAD(P)H-binding protein [bacterium]NUN46782.1 NAD(P)H-binding protein [bacterium]
MQNKRSALIVGASGLIGQHLLNALLEDRDYDRVIVLVRKPIAFTHAKLTQHVVEFDKLTNAAHWIKAHDVFCTLGTTMRTAGSKQAFYKVDFTYPFECARIAKENGVNNFLVVTAIGAKPSSGVFYSRVKGELENALETLRFRSLSIFRPSFLVGERSERRIGEALGIVVFRALGFLLVGRWKKYRAIRAQAVAEAMIEMAKHERAGKTIYESDVIQTIFDVLIERRRRTV